MTSWIDKFALCTSGMRIMGNPACNPVSHHQLASSQSSGKIFWHPGEKNRYKWNNFKSPLNIVVWVLQYSLIFVIIRVISVFIQLQIKCILGNILYSVSMYEVLYCILHVWDMYMRWYVLTHESCQHIAQESECMHLPMGSPWHWPIKFTVSPGSNEPQDRWNITKWNISDNLFEQKPLHVYVSRSVT